MKPKECVLSSHAQLPSTIFPDEVAKQLKYLRNVGDAYTTEYECNICKKTLIVVVEDYHVLYSIFPKLPCED